MAYVPLQVEPLEGFLIAAYDCSFRFHFAPRSRLTSSARFSRNCRSTFSSLAKPRTKALLGAVTGNTTGKIS